MRGSLWEIVVIGVGIALLPAIFAFGEVDDLGSDVESLLAGFAPTLLWLMFFVAAMALLVAYLFSDNGF